MLKDYRLLPKTPPENLVILLHGVGANGEDLLGLAEMWQGAFPRTAFISPDAPEAYDMAPFGRQWFSLRDRAQDAMETGIRKSHPLLDSYIDALLKEFSLDSTRCALLGFSQGTMMSLYTGLRRAAPLAGILGYSGALLGADSVPQNTRPPVCLLHGLQDDVVPAAATRHAADILGRLGCAVETHFYEGLGHSIDQRGLAAGAAFLQRTLKNT